jgi:hypothetical protein
MNSIISLLIEMAQVLTTLDHDWPTQMLL